MQILCTVKIIFEIESMHKISLSQEPVQTVQISSLTGGWSKYVQNSISQEAGTHM